MFDVRLLLSLAATFVSNPLLHVLHEDESLLAVNKPAGLVCHPTKGDEYSSLISRARLYLGAGSHPQLVNRLDRETSGVTLLAKEPSTARRLRSLFERREVRKEYLAIVHGRVEQEHGIIDAPLGKDEQSRVAIKDCVRPDGAPARTEYWVERRLDRPFTVLRVIPHTGRKHQIRIHLAHVGHPIVGDKLYGGDEDLYLALVENRLTDEQRARLLLPFHALHARALEFTWKEKPLALEAKPEPWFTDFLSYMRRQK
jgi:23S rRNA pseudouridine1911/1915/1917 synthase